MADDTLPKLIFDTLHEVKRLCKGEIHQSILDKTNNSIELLNKMIEDQNFETYQIAANPFFDAMSTDPKVFQLPILKCFHLIFIHSKPDNYPHRQFSQFIINATSFTVFENDEIDLLAAQICHSCISSISGSLYIHGPSLRKTFEIIFTAYSCSKNPEIQEQIKSLIEDLICLIVDRYSKPPSLPQTTKIDDFATQLSKCLIANTIIIRNYMGSQLADGFYSFDISDVDLYVVLSFFCKAVENTEYGLYSQSLAVIFLCFILKMKSDFFKKSPAFKMLLNKYFPSALIYALFHRHNLFTKPAIELLMILYKDFRKLFSSQFSSVLMKGLYISLDSPNNLAFQKGIDIVLELIKETSFFPDMFANFDSNIYFPNVFQLITESICANSFPKQKFQKIANNTLKEILQMMIKFLTESNKKETFTQRKENTINDNEIEMNGNNKAIINFESKVSYTDNFVSWCADLRKGVEFFNKSPEKGIRYLINKKIIENKPESISQFLFKCEKLNKNQIGMFLTESSNIEYLNLFMRFYDFNSARSFDDVLRIFLSHISMPKTESKIKFLLNEFGKIYLQFFKQSDFLSEEAVVSFADKLLSVFHGNSKLPSIDHFIMNMKGVNNGNDLPIEFLKAIFNNITTSPIILAPLKNSNELGLRQPKVDWYIFKCNQQISLSKITSPEKLDMFHHFECNNKLSDKQNINVIRAMFESIWGSIHGALIMNIESSNDIEEFLDELKLCIKIAARCGANDTLKLLMSSLATFGGLRTMTNSKMTQKNYLCFQNLIDVSISDGDFLAAAWQIVIEQISLLDKKKPIETSNLFESIDSLLNLSSGFALESVIEMIKSVCQMSKIELKENPPRVFMIEKLVLMTQYSMKRPNEQWIKLWEIAGNYLCQIAASSDVKTSKMGTNHLRYLASKFLLKDELSTDTFQAHFMLSFLNAFQDQCLDKSRIYLLECLDSLIREMSPSLKSGWFMIFQILTIATSEPVTQNIAFKILTQLVCNRIVVESPQYVTHLISFIATFTKNANSFTPIPFFDKVSKSIFDKKSWIVLFESIERCSQCSKIDVKIAAQDSYLRNLVELAERKFDDKEYEEVWETAIVKTFEKFSFVELDKFIVKLNESFIEKFVFSIGDNIKHVIKILIFSVFTGNEKTSKISIQILLNLVSNNINPTIQTFVISILLETAEKVSNLSLNNARSYVSILHQFAQIFQAKREFINIFSTVSKFALKYSNADAVKRNVICALAREALLNELEGCEEIGPDEKVMTMNETFQIYLHSGFAQSVENEAGSEWNRVICATLKSINKLDDETFANYFHILNESLLSMIDSSSKAIRSQLGFAIQRKLLLEQL
ncbi:hypothetical protein TRFO_08021 [Tritrichomonas foetus]|uniref:SEC7 domain-containing protein n=1 Tax=Tritrichomonas foetus TaxID=1144522 RepID=A0A1J4JS50_9EUKA|nr:hypothetical protein TRFO_08021 [Tritrichomonas foetus]|eukprot:OHT00348.1 hypothetical protein TRFO_08021 [Tritrichomonas foetus]